MQSEFDPGDWRDESRYAALVRVEPAAFAWEWLRRDPGYRRAAAGSVSTVPILHGAPEARLWGLHAFADPDLPAVLARPVWRGSWLPGVLNARAEAAGPFGERFDLFEVQELTTVVKERGAERLLLSQGGASLRVDIVDGTVLAGPVRFAYALSGFAAAEAPLQTLLKLLRLWRTGRLDPSRARDRNRRLILLLRAGDAARAGATQRDIAESLLSREPLPLRWRSEAPSLRSQAQRLARGAHSLAAGGWRTLLRS